MKNEKIIEACNLIIQGVTLFRDAIIASYEKQEKGREENTQNATTEQKALNADVFKDLACKVAETYRTTHKGVSVEDMYNDIKAMAGNDKKYTYLLNWLSKSYASSLGNFFTLSEDKKKEFVYTALIQNEADVKSILKRRFV